MIIIKNVIICINSLKIPFASLKHQYFASYDKQVLIRLRLYRLYMLIIRMAVNLDAAEKELFFSLSRSI